MSDRPNERDLGANTISPLPGEPGIPNVAERPRISMSRKGLLAVGLLKHLTLVLEPDQDLTLKVIPSPSPQDGLLVRPCLR